MLGNLFSPRLPLWTSARASLRLFGCWKNRKKIGGLLLTPPRLLRPRLLPRALLVFLDGTLEVLGPPLALPVGPRCWRRTPPAPLQVRAA